MSGVFGSLFRGEAARATDDSMRRWKQLFQADEQLDLQKKQMEQAVTMQEDAQSFKREMETLRNDFANDRLDRQQALTVGANALEFLPTVGYERGQEIVSEFEEMGNPLTNVMKLAVRQGLFQNPQDGVDLYNNFLNDPTFRPSWQSLEEAVRVTGQMAGTSEDDIDATVDSLRSEWEERGKEQEDRQEVELDTARANLSQIEANVSHIGAQEEQTREQTELIGAQTQRVLQQVEQSEELQPLIVEGQRLQNLNLERDAERMRIENDYLPEQITAGLSNLHAQTKDIKNGNKFFEATYEDMVTKVAAEAQITQEEARHKVATGLWRDSIIKADLDQANATLDLMELEEESRGIQNKRARLGLEGDELALTEQRLSMLNVLVERGQPELVTSLAPQLLEKVGISEGDRAEIVEQSAKVAGQKRVNQSDLEELQVRVARAETEFQEESLQDRLRQETSKADYDEWKASIAEDQRKFENRISEQQAEAYALNLRNQRDLEGGMTTSTEAHDEVRKALGYGVGDIHDEISGYNALATELLRLENLRESGNPSEIQRIANEIGFSPENIDSEIQTRRQQLNADETLLVSRLHSYASEYTSLTGRMLSPDSVGLEVDHPLYDAALRKTPAYRQFEAENEDAQEVVGRADQLIGQAAMVVDPISAHTGGTIEVYDTLVEEYGEERVEAAGITGPSDLADSLNERSQEVQQNRSLATDGIGLAEQFTGEDYDFDNPSDRREANRVLRNRAFAVADTAGNIRDIQNRIRDFENRTPDPAFDNILEAAGRDPAQVAADARPTFDPTELAAEIVEATGLPVENLQNVGVLDMFGGVNDLDAAWDFLMRYSDRLSNHSLGLAYFDGR